MHTHSLIGLTLSLDSLLKTTSQAKLSEHDHLHISQTEDTDTKPSEPVTGQMTASSDSSAPDSTHSHGQQSEGDSTHTSDSTHHSRSIDKTIPCDSGTWITNSKELYQSEDHTDSHDTSTNSENNQTHHPIIRIPIHTSLEPAHKAIIRCHDKLVTAFSTDILSISGALVAKEFIPAESSSKMLLPNLTPQEKATILVIAITEKIKLVPNRFQELIKIFSE